MLREDSVVGEKSFVWDDAPTQGSESGRPSLVSNASLMGIETFFDGQNSPTLSVRVEGASDQADWSCFPTRTPDRALK